MNAGWSSEGMLLVSKRCNILKRIQNTTNLKMTVVKCLHWELLMARNGGDATLQNGFLLAHINNVRKSCLVEKPSSCLMKGKTIVFVGVGTSSYRLNRLMLCPDWFNTSL